jgi:uncharacterized membrane protein
VNAVEDRLAAVQRQLNALQREMDEIRVLARPQVVDVPAPEPMFPPAPEPVPAWTPPPWTPPPPKHRKQRDFTLPKVEVADLMGARTLAIAGGIVMLLGVVLLFVLAVNRGWIGPEERVLFGVALAKIFLYDLSQLSSIARAASFLAVGALLLTAGFFYQRLSRTT